MHAMGPDIIVHVIYYMYQVGKRSVSSVLVGEEL